MSQNASIQLVAVGFDAEEIKYGRGLYCLNASDAGLIDSLI